jgi:hypothetical protein
LILFEAVVQKLPALLRYILRVFRGPVLRNDGFHYDLGISAIFTPGRFGSQHLYDTATETPYIGWFSMSGFLNDFRRHPIRGADESL